MKLKGAHLMSSNLYDLDELVLKCRNETVKNYIKESINCYNTGAYRSSIVSTWTALVFDLIEKLRELALFGDPISVDELEKLNKARQRNDIKYLLSFERRILTLARDNFELISHLEYVDLNRLQEDRNRCAHPTFNYEGDTFKPPAELARLHIRTAIEHVLQYPPAQGEKALYALLDQITSDYFPSDHEKANSILKRSPLYKARSSLVTSFITQVLEEILNEEAHYEHITRLGAALHAVSNFHPMTYHQVLTSRLNKLIEKVDDEELHLTYYLVQEIADFWTFVDEATKHRIFQYTKSLPASNLFLIDVLLDDKNLHEYAKERVNDIYIHELERSSFFNLHPILADRVISLLSHICDEASFSILDRILILHSDCFDSRQKRRGIEILTNNKNINTRERTHLIKLLHQNNSHTI